MDGKKSNVLDFSLLSETYSLWEKYQLPDSTLADFFPVLDNCLKELKNNEGKCYNLKKILSELEYCIEKCYKCLDAPLIPMIKLLKNLRFHDVVYSSKSIDACNLLLSHLVTDIVKKNENTQKVFEMSLKSLEVFAVCIKEIDIFANSKEFKTAYIGLWQETLKFCEKNENFEDNLQTKLVAIFYQNFFLQMKQSFFIEAVVKNLNLFKSIIEVTLLVFKDNLGGKPKNLNEITEQFLSFIEIVSDKNAELLKKIDLVHIFLQVSRTEHQKSENITRILEIIFNKLVNQQQNKSFGLAILFKVLLITPKEVVTQFENRLKQLDLDLKVNQEIFTSNLKLEILQSEKIVENFSILKHLQKLFNYHFTVIELKQVLKISKEHKGKVMENSLEIIENALEIIKEPSIYFEFAEKTYQNFVKSPDSSDFKEFTISLNFFYAGILENDYFFMISNSITKTELTFKATQGDKLIILLKIGNRIENISRKEIFIKKNEWNSITLISGLKTKGNSQNIEFLLITNTDEHKFELTEESKGFGEITQFSLKAEGKFEYFFISCLSLPPDLFTSTTFPSRILQNLNENSKFHNSILFKWTGDFPFYESNFFNCVTNFSPNLIQNVVKCTRISESLIALGGLQILLPLIKYAESANILLFLLNIIRKVLNNYNHEGLIDEKFFLLFKYVLEKKEFAKIDSTIIEGIKNFVLEVTDTKFFPIIIENLVLNKIWKNVSGTNLMNLFEIFMIHPLKYAKFGNTPAKISAICDYFNYIISKVFENSRNLMYSYYFYVLKDIIKTFKRQNIQIFMLIINKILESELYGDINRHLVDLIHEMLKKKVESQNSEIISYFLSILKNYNINYYRLEAIFVNLIFKIAFQSLDLCNNDAYTARICDFKTKFEAEVNIQQNIYVELDDVMKDTLKSEICKEIIQIEQNDKYKKVMKYAETHKTKVSKRFIDLITNKLFVTWKDEPDEYREIIKLLFQYIEKYKGFSKVIVKQNNFPYWTFDFFENVTESDEIFEILENLFGKMDNFNNLDKLRVLIFHLISKNNPNTLRFLTRVLKNNFSIECFKISVKFYIEALNLCEDLIQFPAYITKYFKDFREMVKILSDLSIVLPTKFSLNFPKGLHYQFYENFENTKEIESQKIIFREGGICRILLKLFFFTLSINYESEIEEIIYSLFKNNKKSSTSEKEWDSLAKDKEVKKLSFLPPKTSKNTKDMIFLYAFVEWHKILVLNAHENGKNFPKPFLMFFEDFKIAKKIKNNLTKECFIINQSTIDKICKFIEDLDENSKVKYESVQGFLFQMKENQVNVSIKNIPNNYEQIGLELETLLLLLTSLKMDILSKNYIVSESSLGNVYLPEKIEFTEPLRTRSTLENFFIKPQTEFNSLLFQKTQKMALKILDQSLSDLSSFEISPVPDHSKVFHIRSNFDNLLRRPTLKKSEREDLKSFKGSFCFSDSFNEPPRSKTSTTTTFPESITDSNLTGLPDSEISINDEEDIIEDTNNLQLDFESEIIKIKGSYYGNFVIDSEFILFQSKKAEKPIGEVLIYSEQEKKLVVRASALPETQIFKESKKIWSVLEIKEIIARRFIHTYSAIEFFFHSGKSIFVNFFTHENCSKALSRLTAYKLYNIPILTRKNVVKYLKLWKSGRISNFEYLMIINKYAGRSFNDISQYPIFPWVVKDYKSEVLDLEDPQTFRDFKHPISAQSESDKKNLKKRYLISEEHEKDRYHHGSHYSNGGIVMHFLVRLEPFTSQSIKLQGGTFDVADRIFFSVKKSWNCTQSLTSDCKELIPEFFYLPAFLLNLNNNPFSYRQNNKLVDHVSLPNWAKKSVLNFIRLHKKALECSYVSLNLNHWIDLIFGCNQEKKNAKKVLNCFFPATYEKEFQEMIVKLPDKFRVPLIHQVVHFGQTPIQIFKNHHMKRDDINLKTPLWEKMLNGKSFETQLIYSSGKKKIVAVMNYENYLFLIKFSTLFTLLKYKINNEGNFESIFKSEVEIKGLPLNPVNVSAILIKNEYIVMAGFEVPYLYINNLLGESIKIVKMHSSHINCLAGFNIIASGSSDSTLAVYNLEKINYLQGHESAISNLNTLEDYFFVISASFNTVLVHDYRTGHILRKIDKKCIRIDVNEANGIIMIETFEYFQFFDVNLLESISEKYEKNTKSGDEDVVCIAGDVMVWSECGKIKCRDYFDGKESEITIENIYGFDKIIYDKYKDLLLFLREGQENSLEVLKEKFKKLSL